MYFTKISLCVDINKIKNGIEDIWNKYKLNIFIAIAIAIGIALMFFFKKYFQQDNEKNKDIKDFIIKSLLLYPFVFVTHICLGTSIYLIINKNNGTLIENIISLFFLTMGISIIFIMIVLLLFNAKKNVQSIILLGIIMLPLVFLPPANEKMTMSNMLVSVWLFILGDYFISYECIIGLEKFSKLLEPHFPHISSEWIGFLGTVATAVISLISAILTNGIKL